MKKLILISALLLSNPFFAQDSIQDNPEIENLKVCEVTTLRFKKDITKCEKGDILSITSNKLSIHNNAYGGFLSYPAKVCDLDTIIMHEFGAICIYRGSVGDFR
jgi:hypothetical protein